jgi:NAD(P)-dependent dehydrogenase (short-subunit alcohol dehydrogenase family)
MRKRFEGQPVLVTGAGSGIGRATARLAAAEGASVACADVDEQGLGETVEAIEADAGRALALHCNVTDPASVSATIGAAADALGGLHAVFNVAGIGGFAHTEDVTFEEWNRIVGVNLTGTFLVSQAALPHLLTQRRSAIANVASVAGLNGQAYSAAYCASKWGVVGLTKALAVEYVKRGLRVNCVCPAGVKTPLMGKFGFPEGADMDLIARFGLVPKFTHPEEVAEALVYLASPAARSINGVALALDFGNSAT